MESIAVLFLALAVLWVGQLAMTWLQAKAFLRDTRTLRAKGRVAIGMGRRRLGRRAYVALAADDAGHVVAARAMSGVTVFARPRPLPALAGARISDLARGGVEAPVPPLILTAASQAAQFLTGSSQRKDRMAAGEHNPVHTRRSSGPDGHRRKESPTC